MGNSKIFLGLDNRDKNFLNMGLPIIKINWEKSAKSISEAMLEATILSNSKGCIKIDVDCFVRSMDWAGGAEDYYGHGHSTNPSYPIGLSYYISRPVLFDLSNIPCARFTGRNESDIIYRNIPSNYNRIIYSPNEKPRKVSEYGWGCNDSMIIHCGDGERKNDRNAVGEVMKRML